MTGSEALSVMNATRDNDRDDYGMGGSWFFWIIIILFFFCGNGWNNNGNNQTLTADEFIKRDIFQTNQNVSNTATATQLEVLNAKYDNAMQTLENRYTNQLGLQNLGSQMQECCCGTQKEILESRYDALLTAKDAQYQLSNCCCDIKNAIREDGEQTRALIQGNTIQELRDQLSAVTNQLSNTTQNNTLISALRPYPTPTYLTCSPYMSSYYAYNGLSNSCGCGSNLI
jgi:hypothetical protein